MKIIPESLAMSFSNYALGRMILHLWCILRGGKFRFHVAGVCREISKCLSSLFAVRH